MNAKEVTQNIEVNLNKVSSDVASVKGSIKEVEQTLFKEIKNQADQFEKKLEEEVKVLSKTIMDTNRRVDSVIDKINNYETSVLQIEQIIDNQKAAEEKMGEDFASLRDIVLQDTGLIKARIAIAEAEVLTECEKYVDEKIKEQNSVTIGTTEKEKAILSRIENLEQCIKLPSHQVHIVQAKVADEPDDISNFEEIHNKKLSFDHDSDVESETNVLKSINNILMCQREAMEQMKTKLNSSPAQANAVVNPMINTMTQDVFPIFQGHDNEIVCSFLQRMKSIFAMANMSEQQKIFCTMSRLRSPAWDIVTVEEESFESFEELESYLKKKFRSDNIQTKYLDRLLKTYYSPNIPISMKAFLRDIKGKIKHFTIVHNQEYVLRCVSRLFTKEMKMLFGSNHCKSWEYLERIVEAVEESRRLASGSSSNKSASKVNNREKQSGRLQEGFIPRRNYGGDVQVRYQKRGQSGTSSANRSNYQRSNGHKQENFSSFRRSNGNSQVSNSNNQRERYDSQSGNLQSQKLSTSNFNRPRYNNTGTKVNGHKKGDRNNSHQQKSRVFYNRASQDNNKEEEVQEEDDQNSSNEYEVQGSEQENEGETNELSNCQQKFHSKLLTLN